MPTILSNTPLLRFDSIAGRLARLPLGLVPKSAVLPVLFGPLRGARWVVGSSTHGCWLGWYEEQKQQRFAALVEPGQTVLDVGAHVGFYTLLASRLVGPDGAVFAFEPVPSNARKLRRHLDLNGARNVHLIETAVGASTGRVRFAPGEASTMGHVDDRGELTVDMASLDDLRSNGRISGPAVMKIDVEGSEYDVLRGASRILREDRPTILLATHGVSVHRRCVQLLRDFAYEVSALDDHAVETTDELFARPMPTVVASL